MPRPALLGVLITEADDTGSTPSELGLESAKRDLVSFTFAEIGGLDR